MAKKQQVEVAEIEDSTDAVYIPVNFTLKSITPLLMHADDVVMADELKSRREKMKTSEKVAGDDRSPAWSWHTYCYHDGEHLVWPSDNIRSCLAKAASFVKYGRQSNCKSLSQSGLLITEENLSFSTRNGPVSWEMIEDWRERDVPFAEQSKLFTKADPDCSLFVKRAKIASSKNVRVRPKFEHWTIKGQIIITSSEISFDKLKEFFAIAGDRVGLGDWRPSAPKGPGPYGRFSAALSRAD